ncbi:glycosyl hydrolase [Aquimarina sp. MMG016]|uniref:glycoside hydrolase family 26 protein n=1 Tax=Aquimarina sp. MMG016 TaxID=2822690 RepID=UPI001B3A679D|nr:glycosyl hydrolase [Aquimarina sp. MMG016]MBQ4818553.1 endo-1,3-beta-xylanase [Aquimarina sp. MMG016]
MYKKIILGLTFLSVLGCKNKVTPKITSVQEIKKEEVETPKRKLAKFEPEEGKVILFVGQELEAVGGLEKYNDGYLDHFDRPAGWTTYTNINPGEDSFGRIQEGLDGIWETHDWGDNDYNVSLQLADDDYKDMALAIGLQFVNHEEKVADGTHDKYINKLADFLLTLGRRPVFLRIAYEFDGEPWNHYDQESTIKAYKRMVDMIRAKGVTNTAFVWQSTGFMSPEEGQLESWYPGDDYVDWLGFSFFNRWEDQKMIEFARKKGKPVFIAEASPTISDVDAKTTGNTIETQLSNPEQAEEAWQKWFIPFFKTIDENQDVVKAVHYINCHWDSHPMWFDNPTFKKIDARLQLSDSISDRWKKITSDPKYIKSSPDLYDKLWREAK